MFKRFDREAALRRESSDKQVTFVTGFTPQCCLPLPNNARCPSLAWYERMITKNSVRARSRMWDALLLSLVYYHMNQVQGFDEAKDFLSTPKATLERIRAGSPHERVTGRPRLLLRRNKTLAKPLPLELARCQQQTCTRVIIV